MIGRNFSVCDTSVGVFPWNIFAKFLNCDVRKRAANFPKLDQFFVAEFHVLSIICQFTYKLRHTSQRDRKAISNLTRSFLNGVV